ncbi:MAG: flavin reductase family protein [Sphingobium sp.]
MMYQQEASFRDAMRRLATTVTIVSTSGQGRRHGITATAVTSLSMDPPSLLVCVNRSGSLHDLLAETDRFCVNLLTVEQVALSNAFAGKLAPEERFLHGTWADDDGGLPYILDAQASIFCKKQDTIQYGSHSIFIGAVESTLVSDDICPLLYSNGAYSRCAPIETMA